MAIKTTIKSLQNQQTFLKLLIFSFVTVMIWIAFSIFSSQQKPQISAELQKMAIPLSPNIDMDVISRIEQKKDYSDQELSNFVIYTLVQDKTGGQVITTSNGGPVPTTSSTAAPTAGQTTPTIPATAPEQSTSSSALTP